MSVFTNWEVEGGGIPKELIPGDPYRNSTSFNNPDAIIGYDSSGEPIKFSNDVWDLKRYSTTSPRTCTFYFSKYPELFRNELKEITYRRLFSPVSPPRTVASVSPGNISPIWRFLANNKISLATLYSSATYRKMFLSNMSELTCPTTAERIDSFFKEMYKIAQYDNSFTLSPKTFDFCESVNKVRNLISVKHKVNQTPVIPSRIYCNFLVACEEILDDFVALPEECFVKLWNGVLEAPGETLAVKLSNIRNDGYQSVPNWRERFSGLGMIDWCEKYAVFNSRDVYKIALAIQLIARFWIHAFTGMRANEVSTLSFDCFTHLKTKGVQTSIITGYTSKLTNDGILPTFWVTIPVVEKAIKAAQHITKFHAIWVGVSPSSSNLPLLSTRKKPVNTDTRQSHSILDYDVMEKRIDYTELEPLAPFLKGIVIEQNDLDEIKWFESFSPDLLERYKVGQPWAFATHQFRRSLAVYAARSGMVSLGAMTSQFKQIYTAMQSYYARGSAFAVNIIGDTPHSVGGKDQRSLIRELEIERATYQFMQFEQNVIDAHETLWGGAGISFVKSEVKGVPLVLLNDRQFTKKTFDEGRVSFKESPIGWCTRIGPCDRISITNPTECITCDKSVLDKSSIEKIRVHVKRLEIQRAFYSEGSLHYNDYSLQITKLKQSIEKAERLYHGD